MTGANLGWWIGLISGSWTLLLGAVGTWRSLRLWYENRRKPETKGPDGPPPGPPPFTAQRLVSYWRLLWHDQAKAIYLSSKTLTLGLGVLFSLAVLLFWLGAALAALLAALTGDPGLGPIAGEMAAAGRISLVVVLAVTLVGCSLWYGSSQGLVRLRKMVRLNRLAAKLGALSTQKSSEESHLRYLDWHIADIRKQLGLPPKNAVDAASEAALDELLKYVSTWKMTELRSAVEDHLKTEAELPIKERKMKQIRAEIERVRREE